MVDFSKYKIIEVESIEKPIQEIASTSKLIIPAQKKPKAKGLPDEIKITSDNFRTSFFLMTNTTTRKSIPETKEQIIDLFNNYEIIEKSPREFYFIKKD